jgi:hypothetical protein
MPVLLIYFLDSEDILLQGIRGKERGFLFGLDPNQVLSAYGVSFQLLALLISYFTPPFLSCTPAIVVLPVRCKLHGKALNRTNQLIKKKKKKKNPDVEPCCTLR